MCNLRQRGCANRLELRRWWWHANLGGRPEDILQSRAARELGISRVGLANKIRRYHLDEIALRTGKDTTNLST